MHRMRASALNGKCDFTGLRDNFARAVFDALSMTFAPSAHHHSGDPRQPDSAGGICVNHESVHSSGGNSPCRSLLERSISSGLQGGPRHGSVCPGRCFLEAAEKVGSTRCCSVWCLVPLLGGVVMMKSLMTSGKGTHVPKYSPERSLRAAASTVSPVPEIGRASCRER